MRLFGLDISRAPAATSEKALSTVGNERGGWFRVFESFSGAFQQSTTVSYDTVLSHSAVYACATLIASDIAKLRVKLVEKTAAGIWQEIENPAYSPVLRKPNPYQTRIQFWETYILSKLLRGNTYVLKQRNGNGNVIGLYVLDSSPGKVTPLIADTGDVFYELQNDNLSGLPETVTVPAREIIHDRWNCLYHPLVGQSPIFAAASAATQGVKIQNDATSFFSNRSTPAGILVAPGAIGSENATRLKEYWEANYSGENSGKIAVLGDGMKFEQLRMSASDSQMIEQLKWTSETIASVFHVPAYKLGIGQMPTYNNIQSLNVEYYSQALQRLIEDAEVCLDEALNTGSRLGTEFDLDGLLRMDSITQINALGEAVKVGIMAPNEARAKLDLGPKAGGDSPYLQQQNYSLEALGKRDAQDDPFKPAGGTPTAPADQEGEAESEDTEDAEDSEDSDSAAANDNAIEQMQALLAFRKGLL